MAFEGDLVNSTFDLYVKENMASPLIRVQTSNL
jgi:hypothetical protein